MKKQESKKCERCGNDFYRKRYSIKKDGYQNNELHLEFKNRRYCSDHCNRSHWAKAHELVRITTGELYVDLTGKLTSKKEEAIVMHTKNADKMIAEMKYQGCEFKQERNSN